MNFKTLLIGLSAFAVLSGTQALGKGGTNPEDDTTIRPGTGIGIVRLGMNRDQITKTLGKRDGQYELPGKIKVEFSQWKDPQKTTKFLVFFDEKGKAIQLVSEGPVPATSDGISIASSSAAVLKKYKGVQKHRYTNGSTNIDYYDDIQRGITFKFAGTDINPKTDKLMMSILVHTPGRRFIADSREVAVAR